MFSKLKILKTTTYLSVTTDFKRNRAVYEKKIIIYHPHVFQAGTSTKKEHRIKVYQNSKHSCSQKLSKMMKKKRILSKELQTMSRK